MIGWRLPVLLGGAALLIAGCASQPRSPASSGGSAPSPQSSKGGGYYQNDGPPDDENIDLDAVPDAVPRDEPFSRYGNPDSYEALGKTYYVLDSAAGFTQTGRASWYGKQFHGRRTSSGEPYNMFKMTAAHKRLPVPSYVRVTNLDNGKQVIVRVNDRGPFHDGRIIDLSYVAARRLDVVAHGSVPVRIETVTPATIRAEKRQQQSNARASTPRPPQQARRTQTTTAAPAAPAPSTRAQTNSNRGRAIPVANRTATPNAGGDGYYLQSGAFGERDNAQRLKQKLGNAGFGRVSVVPPRSSAGLYRVRLGPFDDERSRALNRQILVEQGFSARNVDR
ncbi:rare lipoprotein A [Salinisphaera dokdonensis CL-ES53]|uniref:Endolytic peptidoglycan transglycosylase RlpA n=1 Tax=Salinisphaera dokdonensis CL-ES53 TaxID=1304272 RepID=A0ABV2B0S7_9GAMM